MEESQQLVAIARENPLEWATETQTFHSPIAVTEKTDERYLPHTNWRFGADFLLYDIDYGTVNFRDSQGDNDLASGLRLSFGWESNAGYGIRVLLSGVNGEGSSDRYVMSFRTPGVASSLRGFDFRGVSPLAIGSATTEITTATSNIDVYKRVQAQKLDVLFGAGLSGAGTRIDVPVAQLENSVIGGGFSLFSEAKYVFYRSEFHELAVVGHGRVALLDGEWEAKDRSGFVEKDSDLSVTEGAIGLQWKRNFGRCGLVLASQYEHQLWNSDVTSDLVLNGAAIRAGLSW